MEYIGYDQEPARVNKTLISLIPEGGDMAWEPLFVYALNQLYMYMIDPYTHQIFQLVMSLPAVSLGLKSHASRRMG